MIGVWGGEGGRVVIGAEGGKAVVGGGGVVVVWLDWPGGWGRPERLPTTFLRTLIDPVYRVHSTV